MSETESRQDGPVLIGVMGPTASGKTDLAEGLASELDAQLINADAFQVYRGLDVGTGKSNFPERYDLLSFKDPSDSFGVGEFIRLASARLWELYATGRSAIVVGGTGFYVRALFEEFQDLGPLPDPEVRKRLDSMTLTEAIDALNRLSPEVDARLDWKNPVRVKRALERALAPEPSLKWCIPPYKRTKFAVIPSSDETERRVEQRVQRMMQNGWVDEVATLRDAGFDREAPGFRAIGYRSIWQYLDGELGMEDTLARITTDTRVYAKKQRTWLRAEPNLIPLDISSPLTEARQKLSQKEFC